MLDEEKDEIEQKKMTPQNWNTLYDISLDELLPSDYQKVPPLRSRADRQVLLQEAAEATGEAFLLL